MQRQGARIHMVQYANDIINISRNYNGRSGQLNRGWKFNGPRNENRGCYGCAMAGHNYADCWFSQ